MKGTFLTGFVLSIVMTLRASSCLAEQVPQDLLAEQDLEEMVSRELEVEAGRNYDLLKSLAGTENLRIDLFPSGAVVQGDLLTPEDLWRVNRVAQSLEGVVNLCTLHPEALDTAARFLNQRMNDLNIRGLTLFAQGGNLMLTGSPLTENDRARAMQLCAAFNLPVLDGTEGNRPDSRMVLFEVSFTEVNRDSFREIGIDWPGALPFADAVGMRLDRLSPSQPLEVTLNLLAQKGQARVLSKPRILCRTGESASFQAGGEIPIPKSDGEGKVSVTWKRYGIILEASPVVDSEGRIHARVMSEVSTVDRSNAVEGIPGILTRRIDTYLSLAPGQAAVLSGLVSSEDGEVVTGIPLLGDIPILGELFRSHSFQKRETELVVFLTPNLVGIKSTPGTLPLPPGDELPE